MCLKGSALLLVLLYGYVGSGLFTSISDLYVKLVTFKSHVVVYELPL